MTASGRYASPDSSFGRSTGNAAARGGALIAVAVVIGFLLLWQGGVGGADSAVAVGAAGDDAATDSTDDQSGDETTDEGAGGEATDETPTDDATDGTETDDTVTEEPTVTEAPVTTRPPGEVRAAVANGTDTSGLAGARSGELATAGYVTAAVNAFNDTAVSNVYYIDGYGPDAEQVAIVLGGTAAVLRPATAEEITGLVAESNRADVEGFHIVVVLGTDGVLG